MRTTYNGRIVIAVLLIFLAGVVAGMSSGKRHYWAHDACVYCETPVEAGAKHIACGACVQAKVREAQGDPTELWTYQMQHLAPESDLTDGVDLGSSAGADGPHRDDHGGGH